MPLTELIGALPAWAADLRANLDSVLAGSGAPGLATRQIHAVALSAAISARHRPLTDAIDALAATTLSDGERDGVRAAAAMMAMSNVYHRATHLLGNPEYAALRARLRTSVMIRPGIDKPTFEAAAVAASAINGCGACLDAHEAVLRAHGVDALGVQSVLRIAAIVHALAVTLEQGAPER